MEDFIKNEFTDRNFRVITEWEKIKDNNPAFSDVFKGLEKEAIKEIYDTKDIVIVHDKKISEFLEENLDFNSELILYLIEKIGYMSIYNRRVINSEENIIIKQMNVDNVSCFRALLVINLLAIVNYSSNDTYNYEVNIIFEKEEYKLMLSEMIKKLFPQVLKQISKINIEVKEEIIENLNEKIGEDVSNQEKEINLEEDVSIEESKLDESTIKTKSNVKNIVEIESDIVEDNKLDDLNSIVEEDKSEETQKNLASFIKNTIDDNTNKNNSNENK